MADLRAKEIKRAALNEILDYIGNCKGVMTEAVYPEVVRMVRTNAFRTLPPLDNPDFDPDEDEPPLEASWPHLEVSNARRGGEVVGGALLYWQAFKCGLLYCYSL